MSAKPKYLCCQLTIGGMNDIQAISSRRPAAPETPFSQWKKVRLLFLYAILRPLWRVGIRA